MGRPGRRPERLAALAAAYGVSADDPSEQYRPEHIPAPTAQDIAAFQTALNDVYRQKSHLGKNIFRKKSSTEVPKSKEATAALEALIKNGRCTVSQASYALEQGADVNFSRYRSSNYWKQSVLKDQEDVRSPLFEDAVRQQNSGLVGALIARADQLNIQAAIDIAVQQRDHRTVRILMSAHADPNLQSHGFQTAVNANDVDMVTALCSGPRRMSRDWATTQLSTAITQGHLKIVQLLLWCDADATFQEITGPVHNQRYDLVAALCLARYHPQPQILARPLLRLLGRMETDTRENRQVVELLLAAGAQGDAVAAALTKISFKNMPRLVSLLINYSSFHDQYSPTAIKGAMSVGDTTVFELLIALITSAKVADELLKYLSSLRSSLSLEPRMEMLKALLSKKPSSTAIDTAIIDATAHDEVVVVEALINTGHIGEGVSHALRIVLNKHFTSGHRYELIRHLLRGGANVDFDHGFAFSTAVKYSDVQALRLFVDRTTQTNSLEITFSTRSLEVAFTTCMQIPASKHRLEILQLLINKGVRGTVIDQALVQIIQKDPESKTILELLLNDGQADVNYNNAESIHISIQRSDQELLKMLLAQEPNQATMDRALLWASEIKDPLQRLRACTQLVERSPRPQNSVMTEALVSATKQNPIDRNWVGQLIDWGASADHDSATILKTALAKHDLVLLKLLVAKAKEPETLRIILQESLLLSNDDEKFQCCSVILENSSLLSSSDLTPHLYLSFSHSTDLRTLRLMLDRGALINSEACRAVQTTISANKLEAFRVLMNASPTETIVKDAFEHAWKLQHVCDFPAVVDLLMEHLQHRSWINFDPYITKAVSETPCAPLLVNFLIQHRMPSETQTTEALETAGKRLDHEILRILLPHAANRDLVSHAFDVILVTDDVWMQTDGVATVRMFLEHGASGLTLDQNLLKCCEQSEKWVNAATILDLLVEYGADTEYRNGLCLKTTGEQLNLRSLKTLLSHTASTPLVSEIFATVMKNEDIWMKSDGIEVVRLFVENGARGEALDINLLKCCEQFERYDNAKAIMDILTQHGGSADHQNGLCLEITISKGFYELVPFILRAQPSTATIHNAFPFILTSGVDEDTALNLMETLHVYCGRSTDFNAKHKTSEPLIFLALEYYPKSSRILNYLLDRGAHVDQLWKDTVVAGQPAENVTPLVWILSKPELPISDDVILTLIKRGANKSFQTSKTRTSPLIAISTTPERYLVLKTLVQPTNDHKPDVTSVDYLGLTPLCYASAVGETETMRLLINVDATTNDGSLHHAVVEGNIAAIELLLAAGHDPNGITPLHESRPPLELAIRQPTKEHPVAILTQMFRLLIQRGADIYYTCDGKSMLVLALDTPNAQSTTYAFLQASKELGMKDVKFKLYEDQYGLTYSPLSYIVQNCHASPLSDEQVGELRRILTTHHYAEERYYNARGGLQPEGFKNVPEHLIEEHKEELQHQTSLRRSLTLHRTSLSRRKDSHQLRLEHREVDHTSDLRRTGEKDQQIQQMRQQHHTLTRAQNDELARDREKHHRSFVQLQLESDRARNLENETFAGHQRQSELSHTEKINQQRIEAARTESNLQLDGKKQMLMIEQQARDAAISSATAIAQIQRQARRDDDTSAERHYHRLMEARRAQHKLIQGQQDMLRLAAANWSARQRTITYEVEEAD